MKKGIVIAGTSGIGASIAKYLEGSVEELVVTGRKSLDTSSMVSVKKFIAQHSSTDILIMNTGGPPAKEFSEITEEEWLRYHNQLFLSFVRILQGIKINDNGYVFLISSLNIKEPNSSLILSNSYRIALVSVLKSLSKIFMEKNISFINIAPGPTMTPRLQQLLDDSNSNIDEFVKGLPTGRVANPDDIGSFVEWVITNKIKSLNGLTIPFDMGLLNHIL